MISGPGLLRDLKTGLDFFHSGMELSDLTVDETLETWRQSFISTSINLTTALHPPMSGSRKSFSCDSMEELYSHQQYNQLMILYIIISVEIIGVISFS